MIRIAQQRKLSLVASVRAIVKCRAKAQERWGVNKNKWTCTKTYTPARTPGARLACEIPIKQKMDAFLVRGIRSTAFGCSLHRTVEPGEGVNSSTRRRPRQDWVGECWGWVWNGSEMFPLVLKCKIVITSRSKGITLHLLALAVVGGDANAIIMRGEGGAVDGWNVWSGVAFLPLSRKHFVPLLCCSCASYGREGEV